MPALSNTPERRSKSAFLPPNASRARALASACSTTCGGTAVASESKLQGRMWTITLHEFHHRPRDVRSTSSQRYADGTDSMTFRLTQAFLLLLLAGCGASPSKGADSPTTGHPFTVSAVTTFNSPWAMAFLPASTEAIVTEKPGRIWLVDTGTGRKQPVAGAPNVVVSSQGGLLDVALSPAFGSDRLLYLTYSEPSTNGGSGLALARARLEQGATGARLSPFQRLWHDPAGGEGGQFGAIIAFAPDGKSLFLSSGERQRFTPAQDPSQPLGKILHLTLDGKPAPGNPAAGRTGASTVTITNPPANTETAKSATGRTFTWPGPNLTPSETWSSGHRNPYGLAFDAQGRLWETE